MYPLVWTDSEKYIIKMMIMLLTSRVWFCLALFGCFFVGSILLQVTSVLARNPEGETVSFEADAVVMCVSVQVTVITPPTF